MIRTLARALTLSVVLFASAALAQQAPKIKPYTPPTIDCEPNCVSKVLSSPAFSNPYELRHAVNIFRVMEEMKEVSPNESGRTISITGTPQQIAIAEKLVSVFEALHSGGGHSSSVFVAEVKPSDTASTAPEKAPSSTASRNSCEQNTCLIKVLYLPDFPGTSEIQDVVNTLRTIAEFQRLVPNPSSHTIALKGTAEQFEMAERLVTVLEKLRSSGGRNRSSVQFYQLQKAVPEPPVSEKFTEERIASLRQTMCEWTTCSMTALYLPDASFEQLQDALNNIRATAQIQRISPLTSSHILVIRGTPEQVAIAERLTAQ